MGAGGGETFAFRKRDLGERKEAIKDVGRNEYNPLNWSGLSPPAPLGGELTCEGGKTRKKGRKWKLAWEKTGKSAVGLLPADILNKMGLYYLQRPEGKERRHRATGKDGDKEGLFITAMRSSLRTVVFFRGGKGETRLRSGGGESLT